MSKLTTTYIEEDVFYCKSLTCIDKLIYSCLMAHTVPKNRLMSNLSIKKISRITGITDNTVMDSLKHLESEGFLTIIREAYYNKYLFRCSIEKPVIVPIEWITTQDFDVKTKMCYLLLLNTKDIISLSEITELLNIKKCADESIDKLLHAGLIKEYDRNGFGVASSGERKYYTLVGKNPHNTIDSVTVTDIPFKLLKCKDREAAIYSFLTLYKEPNSDFTKQISSREIEERFSLSKDSVNICLKQLSKSCLIKLTSSKPKRVCFLPQTDTFRVYTAPIIDKNVSWKSLAYYIHNYNYSTLTESSEMMELQEKGYIKNGRFIDFSSTNRFNPRSASDVESLIGNEFFDDLTTRTGIAAMMIRDVLINDSKGHYYPTIIKDKNINIRSVINELINDGFKTYWYTRGLLYNVTTDPAKYYDCGPSPKEDTIYNLSDKTYEFVIDAAAVEKHDSYCVCKNCHNSFETFNLYCKSDELERIETGKTYHFRVRAFHIYSQGYNYYLKDISEVKAQIPSSTVALADAESIYSHPKRSVMLVQNITKSSNGHKILSGVVLMKAYDLTLPFLAKADMKRIKQSILPIKKGIKLVLDGNHSFTLSDGIRIYPNKNRYANDDPDSCRFFLTEIIKIDKKSAERLCGELFKHLSDRKPDINGIKSLLSSYYTDKSLAEKFTSKIVLSYTLDMLVNMLSDCTDPTKTAEKVFNDYGLSSIDEIQNNPYLILNYCKDFKAADKIAFKYGKNFNSDKRKSGLIKQLLNETFETGSTAVDLNDTKVREHISDLQTGDYIKAIKANEIIESAKKHPLYSIRNGIITSHFYNKLESDIAKELYRIEQKCRTIEVTKKEIDKYEKECGIILEPEQKEAFDLIANHGVTVLTGGPGTGKSFLIKYIYDFFVKEKKEKLAVMATTGAAAQKLTTMGIEALTLHKHLAIPEINDPEKLPVCKKKCDADIIIVDESSMLSTNTAFLLLKSIKNGSHIVLVGDADQLPSVEPGQVFRDIIDSECVNVVRLKTAHRFTSGSIPEYSKMILNGDNHFTEIYDNEFKVINSAKTTMKSKVRSIIKSRKSDTKEYNDLQIMSPKHNGETGVDVLNKLMQESSTNSIESKTIANIKYYIYDRVMMTKNTTEYKNGTIGYITGFEDDMILMKKLSGETIAITAKDYKNISLCYAATIHKAQGSQFDEVIICLSKDDSMLLNRQLLYTAVTRAKSKLTIIAENGVIPLVLARDAARKTQLKEQIKRVFEV